MLHSLHLQRSLTCAAEYCFLPIHLLGVSFALRCWHQGWQAWVICSALRQGSVLSSRMTVVLGSWVQHDRWDHCVLAVV